MADLVQYPAPGARTLKCVGDSVTITLRLTKAMEGSAFVRGCFDGENWSDVAMEASSEEGLYTVTITLSKVGLIPFKTCFIPAGTTEPLWPNGNDALIKVAPAWTNCGCSVYTAFVRQFTQSTEHDTERAAPSGSITELDSLGYTVIPPSGTFRALAKRLDHIVGELGFHILQLLPIHPVPTTYARMGRYGSPFASQDFYSVDPALAEFDKSATPMDQFVELVDAVHARGARIFLDLPANHTGWASTFQIHHPGWFKRNGDGSFHSPGAWGVTWEDLVELDYSKKELRHAVADVFLFWCSKGVDGFRCDAGYMIPQEIWTHVVRRVREIYPDTVFMLEGLGGKIETTDALLSVSGLDWAYSEIFESQDRNAITGYLSNAIARSESMGPLVSFAETHDNNRLASKGHTYASMRTALCALLSQQGAFGITAGVEWYCTAKIDVHGAPPLSEGALENQCFLISRLNAILDSLPVFSCGAHLNLITQGPGNVIAALRSLPERPDEDLLVLVNLNCEREERIEWKKSLFDGIDINDLITLSPHPIRVDGDVAHVLLPPGGFLALVKGRDALSAVEEAEKRRRWDRKHDAFIEKMNQRLVSAPLQNEKVMHFSFPEDSRRTVMVPPGYGLTIESPYPFRVLLRNEVAFPVLSDVSKIAKSKYGKEKYVSTLPIPSGNIRRSFNLEITGYGREIIKTTSSILALPPAEKALVILEATGAQIRSEKDYLAVLANTRGAMANVRGAWGEIRSQYDALLAINPSQSVPANKQVFFTRCKAWIRHSGYSFELNRECQESFAIAALDKAIWSFDTPVGVGKRVRFTITLELDKENNAATLTFKRFKSVDPALDSSPIELVLRPDIEARDFHGPTLAYRGAEQSYPNAVSKIKNGFSFNHPAVGSCMMVLPGGAFNASPVWSYSVPHPLEAERGLHPSGDLFSPGWFSVSLKGDETCVLYAGEAIDISTIKPSPHEVIPTAMFMGEWLDTMPIALFVANRDSLKTIIAGYPWFLDWGRDTLIVLRGLIAAGATKLSLDILLEFARFEENGTLPNIIHGETVGNRDTSDAPLWFIVAAGDIFRKDGIAIAETKTTNGRTLREVIISIIKGYIGGTPNGIRVDRESGLVFSPSHFTWMDTNYPAGTPRIGYPVEIEALWISALSIARDLLGIEDFKEIERRARASLTSLYPTHDGWLADSLRSPTGGFVGAKEAIPEDALRPNQLLAVTLGAMDLSTAEGKKITDAVVRETESLLVPGGIRSLGDRPVTITQPVWHNGNLLNDPQNPYWGHYTGDEDTRRKPAYHNGTAWGWQFPLWCEAYAMTRGSEATDAAMAILASSAVLLETGCLGQLPEIMDGDAPHTQRGCPAQAWSISEVLRVWKSLSNNLV